MSFIIILLQMLLYIHLNDYFKIKYDKFKFSKYVLLVFYHKFIVFVHAIFTTNFVSFVIHHKSTAANFLIDSKCCRSLPQNYLLMVS